MYVIVEARYGTDNRTKSDGASGSTITANDFAAVPASHSAGLPKRAI